MHFIFRVQELRGTLQSWTTKERCLHNQPWQCRSFRCLLWPNNSRWRVDSAPKETRRLGWFLPRLGWLQTRLWESKWWILARPGQDSPPDDITKQASGGSWGHERKNGLRWVWFFRCFQWEKQVQAEFRNILRWVQMLKLKSEKIDIGTNKIVNHVETIWLPKQAFQTMHAWSSRRGVTQRYGKGST